MPASGRFAKLTALDCRRQLAEIFANTLFQNSFDAPYARRGGLLLDDFEMPQLARRFCVRAAAHFAREIADGVRFDDVAVLAVEHADDALGARFIVRHLLEHDGDIFLYLFVDEILDRLNFLLRHRAGEVEVEPQALGRDVAALLVDVGRENLL